LCELGCEHDAGKRRWLVLQEEDSPATQARMWVEAVVGVPIAEPFHESLRTGEALCDLANAIRKGVIGKVARVTGVEMSEMRRNAKMNENVGQYVDACAELGMPTHGLFMTADLYDEARSAETALRNVAALAKIAARSADYGGPLCAVGAKAAPSAR